MSSNVKEIHESFAIQAANFDGFSMNFLCKNIWIIPPPVSHLLQRIPHCGPARNWRSSIWRLRRKRFGTERTKSKKWGPPPMCAT